MWKKARLQSHYLSTSPCFKPKIPQNKNLAWQDQWQCQSALNEIMVDRVPSMVTQGNFKQRWCPPAFVARDTSWSPGFAVKLRNLPLASGVVWWTPSALFECSDHKLPTWHTVFLYPMIYKKGNYHGCRTIRPHQVVNSTAFLCTGVESCLKIGCIIPSVIDSLTCECHQHWKPSQLRSLQRAWHISCSIGRATCSLFPASLSVESSLTCTTQTFQ